MHSRKRVISYGSRDDRYHCIKLFHAPIIFVLLHVAQHVASRSTYVHTRCGSTISCTSRSCAFWKTHTFRTSTVTFLQAAWMRSSLTSFAYRGKDCRVLLQAATGRKGAGGEGGGLVPVNRNPR